MITHQFSAHTQCYGNDYKISLFLRYFRKKKKRKSMLNHVTICSHRRCFDRLADGRWT